MGQGEDAMKAEGDNRTEGRRGSNPLKSRLAVIGGGEKKISPTKRRGGFGRKEKGKGRICVGGERREFRKERRYRKLHTKRDSGPGG